MRGIKYKRELTKRFYNEIWSLKSYRVNIERIEIRDLIMIENMHIKTKLDMERKFYERFKIKSCYAEIYKKLEESAVTRFGTNMWEEIIPENRLKECRIEDFYTKEFILN